MPVAKTWANVGYTVPAAGDPRGTWGRTASLFLQALADKAMSTYGGNQALTGADLDLGGSFGVKAHYYKSRSTNIAQSQICRFANNEGIAWRNAGNTADLGFKVNASNALEFDGKVLSSSTGDLNGIGANGIVARVSANNFAPRTMTAGSNKITISNGDGASGNPTFDVAVAGTSQAGVVDTGTQTFAGAKSFSGVTTIGPTGGGAAAAGNAHTVRADAVSTLLVDNTASAATGVAINMQNSATVRSRWSASSVSALQVSNAGVAATLLDLTHAGALALTAEGSTIRAANVLNDAGAFIGHRTGNVALWGALGSSSVVFRVNSADVGSIATTGAFTLGSTASNQNHTARGINWYIRNSDGTQMGMGVTGSGAFLDSFGQDNATNASLQIRSLRNDGSNTIVGATMSSGGTWTFGPANAAGTTPQIHTLRADGPVLARLTASTAATSYSIVEMYKGTTRYGRIGATGSGAGSLLTGAAEGDICIISSSKSIRFSTDEGTTDNGNVGTTGGWTFGSSATNGSHVLQSAPTSGYITWIKSVNSSASTNGSGALAITKGSNDQTNAQVFMTFGVNGTVGNAGGFRHDGGAGPQIFSSSDKRIKTNIAPLGDCLSKILALNPVTFEMKANPGNICSGFIAQEVNTIFPEMVTRTDDGGGESLPEGVQPWTLSKDNLCTFLVGAIKEQQILIESLKARLH